MVAHAHTDEPAARSPIHPSVQTGMARVVELFGDSYEQRYPDMLPSHSAALWAIRACRTPRLGGHEVECRSCGILEEVYHSCGSRFCPRCSAGRNEAWIAQRKADALPVEYFQVVFTVPEAFRYFFRCHQKAAYKALVKAAQETLLQVVGERHGGLPGVMTVLHTWTRTLAYHPHAHCMVPSVVLGADGKLKHIGGFLASSKQLAQVFRQKLFATLRAEVHVPRSLGQLFRTNWVVSVGKSRGASGEQVIDYLGRYMYRTAISDHRIVAVTDTTVTFKYKSEDRKHWRLMTLPGHEFLRRYLQHVLPSGFHKVRYAGLWSSAHRDDRRKLRAQLLAGLPGDIHAPTPEGHEPKVSEHTPLADYIAHCPHCQQNARVIRSHIVPPKNRELTRACPRPRTRPPP